ncbi:hypothetical protein [Magnetococcus sp. PR-3]|uniref:hypothetical protein n=1 Tax=Magnetococcus sp. PR-3 TaxID=3120355 RepID=UPI002FCE1501
MITFHIALAERCHFNVYDSALFNLDCTHLHILAFFLFSYSRSCTTSPHHKRNSSTSLPPSPKPTIDAEFALKSLGNAEKAFSGLVSNLNIAITFGGTLIALIGLVGIILIGRQGDKHKKELEEKIEFRDKSTAENRELYETGLSTRFDQLSNDVEERLTKLQSTLPTEIERIALQSSGETTRYLKAFKDDVIQLQKEMEEYKGILSIAKESSEEIKFENADPYLDYLFVKNLNRPSEMSNDIEKERLEAVDRLKRIIRLGLEGRIESNLLFNSGMAASRAELENESLQLFTIASWASPFASYELALYRLQMTMGRKYEIKDDGNGGFKLELHSGGGEISENIIADAFTNALIAASDSPLPQSGITYNELWNMAHHVRSVGGFERMRDILEASLRARLGEQIIKEDFSHDADQEHFSQEVWDRQKGKAIPSYLPGKLSVTYSLIGIGNWVEQYKKYLEMGVKIAATESPLTTWRDDFIREAINTALGIQMKDDLDELFQRYGVKTGISSDEPDARKLFQMLHDATQSDESDESDALEFLERLRAL